MIKIELPWPPSINTYWTLAHGNIVISGDGKKFRSRVRETIIAMRQAGRIPQEPLKGRLGIFVEAFPPDGPKRKRDLSNLWKCLHDSLEHAELFLDDEQFDDDRIVRREIKSNGLIIVTIWEL